jgi:hypothetical protein
MARSFLGTAKRPPTAFRRARGNPPELWITLWATMHHRPQSREKSGLATDCPKVKQENIFENQTLA